MNDEKPKRPLGMTTSFEPSVHIAGITPKKSKISDVVKILCEPDEDMDSKELSIEEYTLESVRILKYHKIGLRFCIGMDDVDALDPVINLVQIIPPLKENP